MRLKLMCDDLLVQAHWSCVKIFQFTFLGIMPTGVPKVIYKAFCSDLAKVYMNEASNETLTQV